jgi:hypothetical protein
MHQNSDATTQGFTLLFRGLHRMMKSWNDQKQSSRSKEMDSIVVTNESSELKWVLKQYFFGYLTSIECVVSTTARSAMLCERKSHINRRDTGSMPIINCVRVTAMVLESNFMVSEDNGAGVRECPT